MGALFVKVFGQGYGLLVKHIVGFVGIGVENFRGERKDFVQRNVAVMIQVIVFGSGYGTLFGEGIGKIGGEQLPYTVADVQRGLGDAYPVVVQFVTHMMQGDTLQRRLFAIDHSSILSVRLFVCTRREPFSL